MSNGSDPNSILDALRRAQDGVLYQGQGRFISEEGIESGGDWKTQLTKACELLEVLETTHEQNSDYTAVIELRFGTIERSIEAYAVAMGSDDVDDFRTFTLLDLRFRPIRSLFNRAIVSLT
jgi:hypothetical protein